MDLYEGLGYLQLTYQEQQAYSVMLNAFSSMEASFDYSGIDDKVDLMKVLQTVTGDNPQVFYFNNTFIKTERSGYEKRIILTDVYSKSSTDKMLNTLESKTDQIISDLKSISDDGYSLLINLYHYIQKNIHYDEKEFKSISNGKSKNPFSHNAYGALINGLAVCDGFSSAFSLLAQKLGFECMLAVGHSAYSSRSFTNHAWNIIKIQDSFYHIDSTWDTRKFDEFREYSYVYLLNNDIEIANDHKWDRNTTPSCDNSDLSYYRINDLYFYDLDELIADICNKLENQTYIFRYRISYDIPIPKNTGEYLADKILNEAVKHLQRARISYGWNEHARCFFGMLVN